MQKGQKFFFFLIIPFRWLKGIKKKKRGWKGKGGGKLISIVKSKKEKRQSWTRWKVKTEQYIKKHDNAYKTEWSVDRNRPDGKESDNHYNIKRVRSLWLEIPNEEE